MQPHLDLACAELYNTQEELNISQDTTRDLAVRVTELENQLELFQTTLDRLSLGMEFEADLKVSRVNTFETQIEDLQVEVDDLDDRVETVEMIVKDAVQLKHEDILPPYIWTVTEFWETVRRAKNNIEVRIKSDPFYVGLHGYKVQLLMYPNGTKRALNSFISLYFAVMKGQYDAILPWPFRYKVNITIIDQNPDLTQRQNVVRSFVPDPSSENMQRPESEQNCGQGFQMFLSHEELMEGFYVVDETLFIKFEASRSRH